MIRQKVKIINISGLHLRPTGMLCNEAVKYESTIKFQFKEKSANAKSVLSVLGACVKYGDEIEFICEGSDEEQAINAMVELVNNGLGE